MTKVKFGVDFDYYLDFKTLKRLVSECEGLGFDSAWTMDHLIWHGTGEVMECLSVLSGLAAVTSRIRLGSMVLCNSYRNPALLAKMAATLDMISEGRLEFGIGAGWKEDEYRAYGYEFPRAATRIEQLRESLIIISRMWTEQRPSFDGAHYSICDAICSPKPIQRPHPPIWVGGGGHKLLKVTAELADGFNTVFTTPDECDVKMRALDEHCNAIHRDPKDVERSWVGELILGGTPEEIEDKISRLKPSDAPLEDFVNRRLLGTPRQCVERIERYVGTGINYLVVISREFHEDLKVFAEDVIPSFR
jgi:F420-dependent oxidoreductase-like protein